MAAPRGRGGSVPIMTRSGRMNSTMALQEFRIGGDVELKIGGLTGDFGTRRPVATGTVDLVATTAQPSSARATCSEAA